MNAIQRISKNIGSLIISQILSNLLIFIYSIYIARYLSVNDFGILSFGLAFISILNIFTDLGLNTLMTREIAINKSQAKKYFNNLIFIKIILLTSITIISLIIINLFNYPKTTVNVISLLILYLILTSFITSFYSLIQGYEKLEYQALGVILNSILMFIAVFVGIYLKVDLVQFASIYVIVGIMVLIYCLIISSKKLFLPSIEFDFEFSKKQLSLALQFGLIGVFSTIYVWLDSLMLFFMIGDIAVGYYTVAYRLVLVLLYIPSMVGIALFPVMSKLYAKSSAKLKTIVYKYLKYMMIIGIPLGVFISILSSEIIVLLFGNDYYPSYIALQILIWATVFTFANSAFVQLFQSINKQMIVTKITFMGLIVNIILNIVLIPKYSFVGASIATLFTEMIVAILLIFISFKTDYALQKIKVISDLFKIIFSSILMGLFVYLFKEINIFILMIFALFIYLILIKITHTIDNSDKVIIKNLIKFKQ